MSCLECGKETQVCCAGQQCPTTGTLCEVSTNTCIVPKTCGMANDDIIYSCCKDNSCATPSMCYFKENACVSEDDLSTLLWFDAWMALVTQ